MAFRTGDAVRLRPGSDYADLLEPWADLTARVVATEGETIAVAYPEPFPAYTGALQAREFEPDTGLAEAPF
jgi:hypothetical protein